jgi:sulfite exporter TauE/SafE
MVTATIAFDRIVRVLSARATLRTVAGALLLAFGLWTAGNALWHGAHHASHGAPKGDEHSQHGAGEGPGHTGHQS